MTNVARLPSDHELYQHQTKVRLCLTEEGTVMRTPRKDRETNKHYNLTMVVSHQIFRVVGIVAGDEQGRLVQFAMEHDSSIVDLVVPSSYLGSEPSRLIRFLATNGLIIHHHTQSERHLPSSYALVQAYLIDPGTDHVVTVYNDQGWQPDKRTYVLGTEVLPDDGSSMSQADGEFCLTHPGGTVDEWLEHVAEPASGNPLWVLGVNAAFLSLCAEHLDMPTSAYGGFHVHCGSSRGKSLMRDIASSVLGQMPQQWRATTNGTEAVALAHSDRLLCIDEIKQAGSSKNERAAIRRVPFQLPHGIGKPRSQTDGRLRKVQRWRLPIYMSNGEVSFEDYVRTTHDPLSEGERARLIDVHISGKLYTELEGERVQAIEHAIAKYRGAVGRKFITALIKGRNGMGLEQAKRRYRTQLEKYTKQITANSQKRVAQRLAALCAAAELAQWLKCLPSSWPVNKPQDLVWKSWAGEGDISGFSDVERAGNRLIDWVDQQIGDRLVPIACEMVSVTNSKTKHRWETLRPIPHKGSIGFVDDQHIYIVRSELPDVGCGKNQFLSALREAKALDTNPWRFNGGVHDSRLDRNRPIKPEYVKYHKFNRGALEVFAGQGATDAATTTTGPNEDEPGRAGQPQGTMLSGASPSTTS